MNNRNILRNKFLLVFNEEKFNLQNEVLKCNLPSLALNSIDVIRNKGLGYKLSGDTLIYGDVVVTFVLNEDMSNYLNFVEWMFQLRDPVNGDIQDVPIQATLQLYNVFGRVAREFEFEDIRPEFISEVNFETNVNENEFMTFDVTFKVDKITIKKNTNDDH